MAELRHYRAKVEQLASALPRKDTSLEASEMLLAAMLTAAQQTKRPPETGDLQLPMKLVAGGGFEPPTFGL